MYKDNEANIENFSDYQKQQNKNYYTKNNKINKNVKYYIIKSIYPKVIIYLNNSYIKSKLLLNTNLFNVDINKYQSRILNLNINSQLFENEICHVKVFKINNNGEKLSQNIINYCKIIQNNGCYQICKNGNIKLLTDDYDVILIEIKRRFDIVGHTQYLKSYFKL